MSIEYKSGGRTYIVSYQEIKNDHYRFAHMQDHEFVANIKDALHLACL